MDFKLPATHCLISKDFCERYCQPISKKSLACFAFDIKAYFKIKKKQTITIYVISLAVISMRLQIPKVVL